MPRKIAVIGAGVMGLDIALEYVLAGFQVMIFDTFAAKPGLMEEKEEKTWRLLFTAMKNRKLVYPTDEAIGEALLRIEWLDSGRKNFSRIAECEAVIEAVYEDFTLKKNLIRDIELSCETLVPFLSNTSTLRIGLLAENSEHPEKIMGFHFFNPVRVMKLVEGIPHSTTSAEVIEKARELAAIIGKKLEVVPDLPGFAVNRLLLPMIEAAGNYLNAGADYRKLDEAFRNGTWAEEPAALVIVKKHIEAAERFLEDQKGLRVELSREKLDEIVKLGTNFPAGPSALAEAITRRETKRLKFFMGPIELCDLVGIDVAKHCLEMLRLQEPGGWGEVPEAIARLAREKKLGRKTGEGFYSSVEVEKRETATGKRYARLSLRESTISSGTIERIKKVFDSLRSEPIEAVVFEIAKCRGADISEFPLATRNSELAEKVISEWHAAIKSIMYFPQPVIAVVRGLAWGGGYELAQACDYIVAAKGTKFSQPEVLLGIMPGGGGTQNLVRRVGLLNAVSLILDPKKEVEAAVPWVDEVVADLTPGYVELYLERLSSGKLSKRMRPPLNFSKEIQQEIIEADALISRLKESGRADSHPTSLTFAAAVLMLGNRRNLEEGLLLEAAAVVKLFCNYGKEIREGIRARLENRDPKFY